MHEFYVFVKQLWVVWLMVLFIGLVVWVYWPRRKKKFEEYGRIPFKDDDNERT
jgi:cytochrome c oxidase cbb3-type subunit 4